MASTGDSFIGRIMKHFRHLLSLMAPVALSMTMGPKANAQMGLGAAQCITEYYTSNMGVEYVHYKNNCGTTYNGGLNVSLVVASSKGAWGPYLLHPSEEVSYSVSSGPFRFWACQPGIPTNPRTGWIPHYTDAYVVCK